ncbi:hypothetical protein QUF63_10830 [Anaerolineales bacterium HSG25]|nr:hypothetical protein [Anaerolineales bacterium HSG25]
MAESLAETLERVIDLCQQRFETVQVIRHDVYDDYAVLWLEIEYKVYLLRIREVVRRDGSRKYAYYAFQDSQVVGGFDNAADPRALQKKYGNAYTQHRLEPIPHYHTRDKAEVELTDEIHCIDFVQWVADNL